MKLFYFLSVLFVIISCVASNVLLTSDKNIENLEWTHRGENVKRSVTENLEHLFTKGKDLLGKPFHKDGIVSGIISKATDIFDVTLDKITGIPQELLMYGVHAVCTAGEHINSIAHRFVPNKNDIDYLLYTSENTMETINFTGSNLIWNHLKFKKNTPTILLVVGFRVMDGNGQHSDAIKTLYNAYKSRGTHNFVFIDMNRAVTTLKEWATLDIEFVAEEVLKDLVKLTNYVSINQIHLMGLNVGAHVAGMMGRRFNEQTGQAIVRITGLDPLRSCYGGGKRLMGLHSGDAMFVDVIHTTVHSLGVEEAIGDADFYPNEDDVMQPGCTTIWCSNERSMIYFAESVQRGNEHNFMAKKCTESKGLLGLSWGGKKCDEHEIPMGYETPASTRGMLYLTTHKTSPFGKDTTSHDRNTHSNAYIFWG